MRFTDRDVWGLSVDIVLACSDGTSIVGGIRRWIACMEDGISLESVCGWVTR
jgi:hypothetical protein